MMYDSEGFPAPWAYDPVPPNPEFDQLLGPTPLADEDHLPLGRGVIANWEPDEWDVINANEADDYRHELDDDGYDETDYHGDRVDDI